MAATEALSAPPESGRKNPLAPLVLLRQSHIQRAGASSISSFGVWKFTPLQLFSMVESTERLSTGLQMSMLALTRGNLFYLELCTPLEFIPALFILTSSRSRTPTMVSTSPMENCGRLYMTSPFQQMIEDPSKQSLPPSHPFKFENRYTPPLLDDAFLIRSILVFSLRSSWWLPDPLLTISTPSRPYSTCGFWGTHSSSQISDAISVSLHWTTPLPNMVVLYPTMLLMLSSRGYSSRPSCCQAVNHLPSRQLLPPAKYIFGLISKISQFSMNTLQLQSVLLQYTGIPMSTKMSSVNSFSLSMSSKVYHEWRTVSNSKKWSSQPYPQTSNSGPSLQLAPSFFAYLIDSIMFRLL